MQRITCVDNGSIAEELGVEAEDQLVSINGVPVMDVVDYEYLCADEKLELCFLDKNGNPYEGHVEKDVDEPLGLTFENSLMSEVRACKNRCVFCFIDQMPKRERKTLYFKDDDWRMSFITGNYITLTNVDDAEFQRILDRRVSPLYISVHATDPAVRTAMMRNKNAGKIMERLQALKDAGLAFHSQIVCCPGLNDGEILKQTLSDLYSLYPAAQSVAIVPVGLTKFRDGLYPLTPFTAEEGRAVLDTVDDFQKRARRETHTGFVYAADELYLSVKRELPPYEAYDGFPQLENGVGLLRLFEHDFLAALKHEKPLKKPYSLDIVGGYIAHAFFEELYGHLRAYGVNSNLHAVQNDFFGHSVTVGGLVTGGDILRQLKGKLASGVLYIPHNMLRENEDVFLDGMTVGQLAETLNVCVVPVRGEGEDWVRTIFSQARGL